MKIIVYRCDICRSEVKEDGDHLQKQVNVIFLTEQNEGRATRPYMESKILDLCNGCLEEVLNGKAIYGTGAMGYNHYQFGKSK